MVLSGSRTQSRFLVLAPCRMAAVSRPFRKTQTDFRQYEDRFAEMQRFRGNVYLSDGAVQAGELIDGRHRVTIDETSWHVLSLDSNGRIAACLRYTDERRASRFQELWVRHAELARSSEYGGRFRRAVEAQMVRARQLRLGFGEVGGWAVGESHRGTLEPLRIILATYALLQLQGGCTGLATATFRHSSAHILRRIGLSPLNADGEALPPYYDPKYGCQMELLSFDSRHPNERYRASVVELAGSLQNSPVICRDDAPSTNLRGFENPAVNWSRSAMRLPVAV
jgi:hypothetical protein